MIRKKIVFLLLCGLCIDFWAQEYVRYTLSNGMDVYIDSQNDSPLVRIDLCIRGGYRSEKKETAGYADINTRLFWENKEGTEKSIKDIGITNTRSQFGSHASVFSCTFPAFSADNALDLIMELASTSIFDDKQLDLMIEEYTAARDSFTRSFYGILHSLVIESLYPYEPWKQTQEMAFCYFTKAPREKMRSILASVRSQYFKPDNSALFISSPLSEEQILSQVKAHFEPWKGTSSLPPDEEFEIQQKQSKIVFVSDGLPQDLEQCITVIPVISNPGSKNKADKAARTVSFLLNDPLSGFKTTLMHNENLGLEQEGYSNVSYEDHYSTSRIIIQSMLKKTDISADKKIRLILDALSANSTFTNEQLKSADAYNEVYLRENTHTGGIEKLIESWAQKKDLTENRPEEIDGTYASQILQSAPHFFILLNTDSYLEQKKNLEKDGWAAVFEKDVENTIRKAGISSLSASGTLQNSTAFTDISKILLSRTGNNSMSALSNGIEVLLHEDRTDTSCIVLTIDGGVLSSDPKKPLIEKILMKHLENEIKKTVYDFRAQEQLSSTAGVTVKAGLHSSSITLTCSTKDTGTALYCAGKALAFMNISAIEADELLMQFSGSEKMSRYDSDYQLYSAAVETIYAGSGYESALAEPELDSSSYTFSEIKEAEGRLFNAERFSLCISTDENTSRTVLPSAEASFGYLKKTGSPGDWKAEPQFPSMTRWKNLYRIFTATVSASEAGERPVKLVPTTVFYDPAHVYFRRPLNENQSVFDALLLKLAQYLEETSLSMEKPPFTGAEAYFDPEIPSLCGIRFTGVASYETMQEITEEAASHFEEIIIDENEIMRAKILWVNTIMNESMTQEGICRKLIEGRDLYTNMNRYLEQYAVLEKSTTGEFIQVFDAYIKKQTSLWILSSDTPE